MADNPESLAINWLAGLPLPLQTNQAVTKDAQQP